MHFMSNKNFLDAIKIKFKANHELVLKRRLCNGSIMCQY